MEHPNAGFIRNLYAAFDAGDLATIQDAFGEEVMLHVGGRNPLSGTYKGKDEVLGLLAEAIGRSEGTFKIEVHDVLGNDDHVAVLSHARGQRQGKTLDAINFEAFHMRDGKVAEAWFFSGDPYNEDEFWS